MNFGEAALSLPDGREFTLLLSNRALLNAERAYGKPIEQTMADAKAGFAGAMAALLHAALAKHHPGIDADAAADMLFDHPESSMQALTLALVRAMPDDDGGAEGNGQSRRAGKNSGSGGAKRGAIRKASGTKRRAATS